MNRIPLKPEFFFRLLFRNCLNCVSTAKIFHNVITHNRGTNPVTIILFVVFNESFHKALVYKSVCVINIAHLIILPATKNPLFDAYFNRITALLTVIFFPVMGAYLRPYALFALRFPLVMRAYLTSFALSALIFVFSVFAKIFQVMRCSGFGHISYFFFHFIKQKNLNSFCKIFQNLKFQNFRFLRISDF